MATTVDGVSSPQPIRGFVGDQPFFTRYNIALVGLILFGFLQFELRGFVDIRTAPAYLHLHGAIMVSWLALTVVQNLLIQNMQVKTHRTVGYIGVALAVSVVVLGSYVGRHAIIDHTVPPFFTNPQFLALTQVEALSFGLLVALAIGFRRQVQFHRRFMLISTIQIVEPAFGRLLPMPLLGGWGEWIILGLQFVMLAILARHDRRVLGAVHPATLAGVGIVVASHLVTALVASLPMTVAAAQALAGG